MIPHAGRGRYVPAVQRVCVVGSPGAGKSTFAAALARQTGLPLIALDRHYWRPGWVAAEPDEWTATVTALAARPRWIIDGNYGGTAALRFARADTIIVLDLPRTVTIPGVLRRTLRNWHRCVQADGCPERLDCGFLWFVWRWPQDGRLRLLAKLEQVDRAVTVIRLSSHRETERYLAGCTSPAG